MLSGPEAFNTPGLYEDSCSRKSSQTNLEVEIQPHTVVARTINCRATEVRSIDERTLRARSRFDRLALEKVQWMALLQMDPIGLSQTAKTEVLHKHDTQQLMTDDRMGKSAIVSYAYL